MSVLFLEYPKCSTCQKAKKWLDERGISYEDRHIVEQNPTAEEIKAWREKSGLPLKRFFNTSGLKYKELGLKDRLPQMSEEDRQTKRKGWNKAVKYAYGWAKDEPEEEEE